MKTKSFADQIRSLRRLKNVTQAQLASAMNYANPSFISQIETGRENVSANLAFELLKAIKECYKVNQSKIKSK